MPGRLELHGPAFTSRAISFMSLLRDPDFHKNFQTDPAGTAMREFHLKLPAKAISSSNQSLALLLQDKAFVKWCVKFQKQIEDAHPELSNAKTVSDLANDTKALTAQIQKDFARAVSDHLPKEFIAGLSPGATIATKGQIASEDDVAILLLVFIAVIVVVVAPRERGDLLSRNTVRLLVNQFEALRNEIGPGV